MTSTIFQTFQTQYIVDLSSASHSRKLGLAKHLRFSSLKMALQMKMQKSPKSAHSTVHIVHDLKGQSHEKVGEMRV
jgi:hypothetical protein